MENTSLRDIVRIVVRGLLDQTRLCIDLDLKCIDPPTLTSGMLRRYGVSSDHVVLNFWNKLSKILEKSNRFEIYRSRCISVNLVLIHRLSKVRKLVEHDAYVDPLDCIDKVCVVAPHSHVLKTYLEYRCCTGLRIRWNLVSLLRLVASRDPSFLECVESFAQDPTSIDRVLNIAQCVLRLLNTYRRPLMHVFDRIPSNLQELVKVSPFLRKIVRELSQRKVSR